MLPADPGESSEAIDFDATDFDAIDFDDAILGLTTSGVEEEKSGRRRSFEKNVGMMLKPEKKAETKNR